MITVTLSYDTRRMATTILIERDAPNRCDYGWVGVLVDERPMPSWWNVRRRWSNRKYRHRIARMAATTLKCDMKKIDRELQTALTKRGVSLT